jgi:hypothetical protein
MRSSESLTVPAPEPGKIQDVRVEVDATGVGDALGSWGVICRATFPSVNHYYLGVFSDGRPFIAKIIQGKGTLLLWDDATSAVTERTTRIRGDCVGSTLTLYVNECKRLEAQNGELTSGRVGLAVEGADLRFDNFRVSKPDR